jgi:hypothetical protein
MCVAFSIPITTYIQIMLYGDSPAALSIRSMMDNSQESNKGTDVRHVTPLPYFD